MSIFLALFLLAVGGAAVLDESPRCQSGDKSELCQVDTSKDLTKDEYGNTCGWKLEDQKACKDAMKK